MDINEDNMLVETCRKCGNLSFDLVDGHFYCTECHEQYEEVAQIEFDDFAHENIPTNRSFIKSKDSQKTSEKEREAIASKKTSYEEYNIILHGMVNEILAIEKVPNFKSTVLQLWIRYLKHYELAFFDNDTLNHLPKFPALYRKKDAEILYNKKPPEKKKRKNYYKKKKYTEADIKGDTKESKKLKRTLVRKSTKSIARKQMTIESDLETSNTSTLSNLSNLTLDDIEATQRKNELEIEFSTSAKKTKENYIKTLTRTGRKPRVNELGEVKTEPYLVKFEDKVEVVNGSILICILFSALNICGSQIQFADLYRFCLEGRVSLFNLRKLLPESLQNVELSLSQYHTFSYQSYISRKRRLEHFYKVFPDIRLSLKMPNLVMLARRYVADLNLPKDIADYVERLMELLPSKMRNQRNLFQNYEGRAMAYILFVLKLMFGIDGYREKEMSESARRINLELKSRNINQKLFVYEDWRETIEYRDIILCKYYYPSIYRNEFKAEKPYETYLSMLKNTKPMSFQVLYEKENLNRFERQNLEKKDFLSQILAKVQKCHENEINPRENLSFPSSFTPLKDAIEVIMNTDIRHTINENVMINHTERLCGYYFKPQGLVNLLQNKDVNVNIKKCTFPKVYCIRKAIGAITKDYSTNLNRNISFDISVDADTWKENFKDQELKNKEKEINKLISRHHNKMTEILKRRLEEQQQISQNADSNEENPDEFDYADICRISDDDESDFKDENSDITFIIPDYNLWHRHISMIPNAVKIKGNWVNRLPKSFLWLLKTASNVIDQDIELIFYEIQLIERQFLVFNEPLELTGYSLRKYTKMDKNRKQLCDNF